MTATHSIAATLLAAIYISKHRHEVLIGLLSKTCRRRLTVMNTLEDFQRVSAALQMISWSCTSMMKAPSVTSSFRPVNSNPSEQ